MATENRYGAATANILDFPTVVQAATWDTHKQIEVARSGGLDGIEYWTIKKVGRGIRDIEQSDIESGGVISAHLSPRPDKIGLTIPELKVAAFLPGMRSSFETLKEVNLQAGGIPIVLYKEISREALESSGIGLRQIQTDPEACEEWNVSNANEFLDSAEENGFTDEHGNPAIVIDTHHVRHPSVATGNENPLANWRESVPRLLPYTQEIHVGVGRLDYGGTDAAGIREELVDLLNGGEKNTEVVQMLRSIADSGWSGLVIIELRPSLIKEYLGSMSEKDLINTYERIRATLDNIFERS